MRLDIVIMAGDSGSINHFFCTFTRRVTADETGYCDHGWGFWLDQPLFLHIHEQEGIPLKKDHRDPENSGFVISCNAN